MFLTGLLAGFGLMLGILIGLIFSVFLGYSVMLTVSWLINYIFKINNRKKDTINSGG